jgi:hypothetical protein
MSSAKTAHKCPTAPLDRHVIVTTEAILTLFGKVSLRNWIRRAEVLIISVCLVISIFDIKLAISFHLRFGILHKHNIHNG